VRHVGKLKGRKPVAFPHKLTDYRQFGEVRIEATLSIKLAGIQPDHTPEQGTVRRNSAIGCIVKHEQPIK
jgi:hypothetical protein